MKQEEILDYNKLCAEFLGWEYIDKDQHSQAYENYGWWVKRIYHNNIDARNNCNWKGFNQNLKFHSDWNWIFEVVEAIEKLGYYTKNECIRNINYFNIYELENNEATFYGTDNSKKEAVVEAINQFLIWHKTNNNEK